LSPTDPIPAPQNLLSPNSIPLPSGLVLKSATETDRDLNSYQVTYLEDQADGFLPENQNEIDMYFGENHDFTVHVNSSKQPLVWATGWCAQGEETLNQNLGNIRFEMSVDGKPVDLDQVYRTDSFISFHNGNKCILYRIIVNGWPSGITVLTSKTILDQPINNGVTDYPIGELVRVYTVVNP
jgi:hypothetical protein